MKRKQHGASPRRSTTSLIEPRTTTGISFFSSLDKEASRACLSQLFSVQHISLPLTPLVGREQEVKDIRTLLQQPEVRLLTLTGPGGVGKTRLAIQMLAEAFSVFADGSYFVSLASINIIDLVLPTIARTLGLNERGDQCSCGQVQAVMQDKHFLLVLDSFEHIADAAPQLKKLLMACPHLKILVTSRTALRLLESQEFYVAPLALPDLAHLPPCEELSQVAAISLFLQRTRTTHPGFELTHDNADAIAQICVRLDGLPLAIELAVARMKLFSPQSLLARLDHRLLLLTSGMRGAPERQQTLRKTMEWSYQLLTAEEQRLFRRLSIFGGSISLQAIEAISNTLSNGDEPVLDAVASLLDHSLLQRETQVGCEEQRFTILETIREYALECLQNSDEEEMIRQAHAEYYLALAKTIKLKMMRGESPYWIEWLESEFENLRVAFGWFLSSRDIERALGISGVLWVFWSRTHTAEGYCWIKQALEYYQCSMTQVKNDTLAQAMFILAELEYTRENWTQGDVFADEALQLFRSVGHVCGIARVLMMQGTGALLRGQYEIARRMADESIQLLQKVHCPPLLQAEVRLILVYSVYFQGDHAQAYTLGKKVLALSQQTHDFYTMMRSVHAQAFFAETQGNRVDIQAMYEKGMEISRETIKTGRPLPIAVCMVGMGAIGVLLHQYIWAVHLWGKAEALYKARDGSSELGSYAWLVNFMNKHLFCSRVVEMTHAHLGEQTFMATWNTGQAMTLEQVLSASASCVISELPSPPAKAPITFANRLTPREREVLCLLAQGLSSALIAEKLVIGLVTVNSHVRTIYRKLGVSSRSAATRYAMEHHLV